jgi:hypothetical protein
MVGGPDDDGFMMAESKYQIHDGPRDCNLRKSRVQQNFGSACTHLE